MEYHEGDNISSLASAEIAMHTDFSGFNPVVFHDGKGWTRIPFKEGSGSLSVRKIDSPNGIIHDYAGRMFMPHWNEEDENELDPFLGQVAVVRTVDMNGKVRIIGAPGYAVTLETSGGTGEGFTAENGTELRFKTEQVFRAFKE
ncbi:hypothetical protein ACFSJU_14855 [Paradesertivirga mongoliensis]|uniref:Uncharacterized protein n=1 Tax=Paradesertivirga mongoliensis TaxID=2100740 RepID=A0ABW4ZQE1_9SPHI|nr:hypothetical protein [Pedobacter mongoliensis]